MSDRILLLAQYLGEGGSERQLTEIARNLDRTRFDVRVGCFRAGGVRSADVQAAGIPIEVLGVTSFRKPSAAVAARRFVRYLRRERIDLVHTFDVPSTIFAVPLARLAGTRVVLSSHRAARALSSPWQNRLLRITDRLVHGIVTNTAWGQRELTHEHRVPAALVHLCHNGLDTGHFRPGPGDARDGRTLSIGTVAVLRPEKSLETLIDAAARVRASGVDLSLLLVGDGPQRRDLEARAAASGLAGACTFAGASREVVPFLQRLDVFVLPSRTEAMSNSLLEAMSCGCVVVATDVGGNPEVVNDGESGYLFPVADVDALRAILARLAADPAERRRLSLAGRERAVRHFDLAVSVARMAEIYASALAR